MEYRGEISNDDTKYIVCKIDYSKNHFFLYTYT